MTTQPHWTSFLILLGFTASQLWLASDCGQITCQVGHPFTPTKPAAATAQHAGSMVTHNSMPFIVHPYSVLQTHDAFRGHSVSIVASSPARPPPPPPSNEFYIQFCFYLSSIARQHDAQSQESINDLFASDR